MIVKAWNSGKYEKTTTYTNVTDISMQFDEDEREDINDEYEPMVNFTVDGGYSWMAIPTRLVISIKDN